MRPSLLFTCLFILLVHSLPTSAESLAIGGGRIEIAFPPNDPNFPRPPALEWIKTAARAVAKYYGR